MERASVRHSAARLLCAEIIKLPGTARQSLVPNQVIATSGSGEALHVIVERGALAVRVSNRAGVWSVLEVLGRGSCATVGYDEAGAGAERGAVAALLPTTVLVAPLNEYLRAVSSNLKLASAAAAAKAWQHAALLRHLAILRIRRPLRRVAGTLIYLADALGEACPLAAGLQLQLTQESIACIAHLSRQTVNRELRRLRDGGQVYAARGMVCCLRADELRAVANGRVELRRSLRPPSCKFLKPRAPLDCAPPHEAR
ncbi:MAG: hypothetical protein A2083_01095 [Gemmatimonadetes bacterium GWC2_71_9]|nr:MAG: hypothetical protein A2083_01095 [Gemmatimonadetes bacterium GWC2_71_9]